MCIHTKHQHSSSLAFLLIQRINSVVNINLYEFNLCEQVLDQKSHNLIAQEYNLQRYRLLGVRVLTMDCNPSTFPVSSLIQAYPPPKQKPNQKLVYLIH